MEVRHHEQLAIAWKVGSINPPELSLTVIAKAVCPLTPGLLSLAASPPGARGDRFAVDGNPESALLYPSDFAPIKPTTDVLVTGSARTPDGLPRYSITAGVSIAGIDKNLTVIGDRKWITVPGDDSRRVISDPQPFISMPIERARSFGGRGFARNPLGVGFGGDRLPNFEDPARLITARDDTPDPASFGPIPADHHPRNAMLGTYDDSYAKTRWPWVPADFDWRHFNAAPIDQQTTEHLRGDELLRLRNFVKGQPDFRTRLPNVRIRWIMLLKDRLGEFIQREVPMILDTVLVDTEADEVTLVWRGTTAAPSMRLREIEFMYATVEAQSQEPTSSETLWDEFDAKAAAEQAPPPEMAEEFAKGQAASANLKANGEKLLAEAQAKRNEALAQADAVRAEKAAFDAKLSAASAGPDDGELDLAAGFAAASDASTATTPAVNAAAPSQSSPPPDEPLPIALPPSPLRARIDMLRSQLENMQLFGMASTDPKAAAITGAISQLESLDAERGRSMLKLTRRDVMGVLARGESLARLSMGSLDLAGIDFSGADLRGANFSESNLSDSKFVGADLGGAILYRADLTRADLTDATCDKAVFAQAILTDTIMTGLSVAGANLMGVDLRGKALTGWKGDAPMLNDALLDDAVLKDAKIPGAMLMNASLHRVDFTGADLTNADLLGASGEFIDFSSVNAAGMRASPGVSMRLCDFSSARLQKSNFNGANLDACDFSDAVLDQSNLSESSLSHALFRRASLAGVDLSDSDLERTTFEDCSLARAMLERCAIDETEFTRVNAWSAGFWLSPMERATLKDCVLKGSSLA